MTRENVGLMKEAERKRNMTYILYKRHIVQTLNSSFGKMNGVIMYTFQTTQVTVEA